jgi:hypothetical protein
MLRRLLVGSAHYNILGPFGQDSDLRRHGEKIASRGGGGGKNAKKRAAVVAGSEKALGALALSVANRRALRATAQHPAVQRPGGLEETKWRGGEDYSGTAPTLKWRREETASFARHSASDLRRR